MKSKPIRTSYETPVRIWGNKCMLTNCQFIYPRKNGRILVTIKLTYFTYYTDSAQLIRLEGVSRQFARRARMIREQPDAAATMARELVRNFTARRQAEGTLSPVRRVRGRPTMEFRIRFTCLQSPSTVNVCRLNLEALRNLGLGEFH